ncbi:MAG: heme-binding protein, partial [Haloarculaceae archaeon]
MVRREPPQTEEGWYALHDLRTIDWDAWQDAPERVRDRALDEAVDFLRASESVTDADEGDSAVYTVLGHKADLMVVHLRPELADLDALERRFETTEFARFTEQTSSYVSVTEASGYSERAREYFEGEVDEDSGLAQYIRDRLHPEIPDAEHVSFYPMSKRRDPDYNWYDLPFEERAEHMASHGDIGRDYAGKVQQMISGSVGLDDWEWGVTLWADDMTDVKDLLYEMRFDPSSSKFAEFGTFYVGRRVAPGNLEAVLAGERVPADGDARDAATSAEANGHPHADRAGGRPDTPGDADGSDGDAGATHPGEADAVEAAEPAETAERAEAAESATPATSAASSDGGGGDGSGPPAAVQQRDVDAEDVEEHEDMARRLARFGVYPEDYDDGDYGLVFYSSADAEDLVDDVEGLRGNFEHYDTHVLTSVRADQGQAAVISVWDTRDAAMTASGFLSDLPQISHSARGFLGDAEAIEGAQTDGSEDGATTTAHDADAEAGADEIRGELAEQDIYAGKPHGEDVYALVLYSTADPETLSAEVDDLRDGFDRYDTHVRTAVYDDPDSETAAVVSLWDTQDAADTAANFLSDLPDIVGRPEDREGFGTMGMFYTVEPEHREDFVEKFDAVGDLLADMDGHRETSLLVNEADENDMFIASQWDAREDAM